MHKVWTIIRDSRGGIAIEFALVAPLLALVYIALTETASAVMNYNRLALATEAAAATLQSSPSGADEYDVIHTVYAAFGSDDSQRLNVAVDCVPGVRRDSADIAVLTVHYDMPSAASRLFGSDITLTVRRATPASAICRETRDD